MSQPDVRGAVDSVDLWYHTLELAPGVVTPGWFDLRPIVDRMPWPDVRGLRCLDVGTYDGFLAFELERRGAREVVALDIADHRLWDWPPELADRGPEILAGIAGPDKGAGFRVAHRALGSSVERVEHSVYDLTPDVAGEFDLVVCGSLLLHLRDPLRALAAMRSVCRGNLLSAEQISASLSLRHRREPLARIYPGRLELMHWWEPNLAGHRRMISVAGFELLEAPGPYSIPFGEGHGPLARGIGGLRARVVRKLATGGQGVPHSAVLAAPRR